MSIFKSKKKTIPILEQLNTLLSIGIRPKQDDFLDWVCDEWGKETVESDPYNLMLFSLGGERENGDLWERLSDDIYSFDTECVEDSNIYEVVLERLVTLSKGSYAISDLHSEVDHDNKKVTVSFAYNDIHYQWSLKYNNDWFDCDVIGKINFLLRNNGSSNFFYTSSPDQNLIVVYTSKDAIGKLNLLSTVPFKLNIAKTV